MESVFLKYIKPFLSQYFEDIQDDVIDIDLLSGKIGLSNLLMRRTTLEFGELRATLLKGSIEQFCLSLNLGWRISNRLRLDIDSVEFTLLLSYDGVQDEQPSKDRIQDPEKRKGEILMRQLQALGFDPGSAKKGLTESFKNCILKVLEKFLLQSEVVVRGMILNLLVMVTNEEVCCFRIILDSLTIENTQSTDQQMSSEAQTHAKVIQFRNISISFSPILRVERMIQLLDQPEAGRLLFRTLLVHPFSFKTKINLACSLGSTLQIHTLHIDLKLDEVQINMQSSFVRLLNLITDYYRTCGVNRQLLRLKELVKETCRRKNCSKSVSLWKIAYYGVSLMRCGPKIFQRLQLQLVKTDALVSEYSFKYLQKVWAILSQEYKKTTEILPPTYRNRVESFSVGEDLSKRLIEIESVLNIDTIVNTRTRIDSIFLLRGLEPHILEKVVLKDDVPSKGFLWLPREPSSSKRSKPSFHFIFHFDGLTINICDYPSQTNNPKLLSRQFRHESFFSTDSFYWKPDPHSSAAVNRFLLLVSNMKAVVSVIGDEFCSFSLDLKSGSVFCNNLLLLSLAYSDNFDPSKFAVRSNFQFVDLSKPKIQSETPTNKYHNLKGFSCSNLRNELNFAFYTPTTNHVVGDVTLGRIMVNISLSPWLSVSSTLQHLMNQPRPDDLIGRTEKNLLATVSMNRYCMSFQQPTKFSLDVLLPRADISVALKEDTSLLLTLENFHLRSGDYKKLVQNNRFGLEDEEFLMSFEKVNEDLKPFVSPIHSDLIIQLRSVQLAYIDKQLSKSLSVISPFPLAVSLYLLNQPPQLDFCEMCTGVVVGNIQIELNQSVLENSLCLVNFFSSGETNKVSCFNAPRIANLAKISKNVFRVILTGINFKLMNLVDEVNTPSDDRALIMDILKEFGHKFVKFETDGINRAVLFRQTKNRFKTIGVDVNIASTVLKEIALDLSRNSSMRVYSQEDGGIFMNHARKLAGSDTVCTFSRIIFGVNCVRIDVTSQNLTYDHSVILEVNRLIVFNNRATSLVQIGCHEEYKSLVSFETDRALNASLSFFDQDFDVLDSTTEDEVEKPLSRSTFLSLVSKSENFSYGDGGYSAAVLYRKIKLRETRNNDWFLDLGEVWVEFDALSIIEILEKLSFIKGQASPSSSSMPLDLPTENLLGEESIGPELTVLLTQSHDISYKISQVQLLFTSKQENFCMLKFDKFQGMFTHSRQNDFRGSIGSLRLLDLTFYARQYRDVIWNDESSSDVATFILTTQKSEDINILSTIIRLHSLRVCFFYRFILQAIDYINNQVVYPIQNFLRDEQTTSSVQSTPTEDGAKVEVILITSDLSVIVPRNSQSSDLLGLTVQNALTRIAPSSKLVSAPREDEISNQSGSVLSFDGDKNEWILVDRMEDCRFTKSLDKLFEIVELNMGNLYDKSNDYYDALKGVLAVNRVTSNFAGSVLRIAVMLREVHIFSSISPLSARFDEHALPMRQIVLSEELEAPLFSSIRHHGGITKWENDKAQLWHQITRQLANLDVIVDVSEREMKLLFCDVLNSRTLDLAVTQAEFYLLLGFWFDNFHETSEPNEDEFTDLNDLTFPTASKHEDLKVDRYGDSQYFSYYMDREMTFELLVVQSKIQLSLAIDDGIFSRSIPSYEYLRRYGSLDRGSLNFEHPLFSLFDISSKQTSNGRRHWAVYPVGQIELQSLIVQVLADNDVSQIGVTASSARVIDGRIGSEMITGAKSTLLSVGNSQHLEGKFGLINFPRFFDGDEDSDVKDGTQMPLSVGILMSSYLNWMNINLYLDSADLFVSHLDITLLLAEYFSCFFRFEEFGSPSLATYCRLNSSLLPYGGTDFRLLLHKPHVALLNYDSQTYLFAEVDNGANYRYCYDTKGSVKTSYDLQSLSLVLVKEFETYLSYRGARGSSGFGSAKTLLEFMNLFIYQLHQSEQNTQDFKVEITCAELLRNLNNFKMDEEVAGLDIIIPETNFLNSLITLSKNFPLDSSDIVISFEDVSMIWKTISKFLDLENDSSEAKADEPTYLQRFSQVNCFAKLAGVRLLLIDNTLGMHLPFFQAFLQEFAIAFHNKGIQENLQISNFQKSVNNNRQSLLKSSINNRHSISIVHRDHFTVASTGLETEDQIDSALKQEARVYLEAITWIDSFNNLKKCWEPFVEPCGAHLLYEKTFDHGDGLTIRFDTPFHFNVSGAIIHTLFDSIRSLDVLSSTTSSRGNAAFDKHAIVDTFEQTSPLEFYSVKNSRERAFSLTNTNAANVLAASRIEHFRSLSLNPVVRVGFSLLNLTGQSIRYLQQWEGGKQTVQYLGSGERGLLNFVPSQTLIRNHKVVEEAFDVQQGRNEFARSRMRKKLVGNRLALQISGYRWIKAIQADELGIQYKHLSPILGRSDATSVYHNDQRIKTVLKLLIEIVPFNQGRMMILRSVFSIRNECGHSVRILTRSDSNTDATNDIDSDSVSSVFELNARENLYLPISLLSKSILTTSGSSLGLLYLQPTDSSTVRDELIARLNITPGTINYSTDPINLFHLAYRDRKNTTEFEVGGILNKSDSDFLHVSCHINPEERSRKIQRNNVRKSLEIDQFWSAERERAAIFRLPPFCYSIEILHDTNIQGRAVSERGKKEGFRSVHVDEHRNFTIVIHPPITIENLLPCEADFEILHATEKRELWSAKIKATNLQSIHTVSLEEPLLLSVNLPYCRASEGILIHQPKFRSTDRSLFANALQRTIEGILDENESESVSTITLYDSVGQGLRLNIENKEGAGGQRHITVYCPYWIVNTSQYSFQIREEGGEELTAGSVRSDKSGKLSTFSPVSVKQRLTVESSKNDVSRKIEGMNLWTIFPGCQGPLHSNFHREIEIDSPLSNLFSDVNFEQIVKLAYMFNFQEDTSLLSSKGSVKLQLDNSEWSKSFSLLNVGVNQALVVNHQEKGIIEVGLKIKSAPGRLAQYTKIVRFTPRFIIVNRMNVVLKVGQVGNFQETSHEVDISPQHSRPYHLPYLFGDRQIYIKAEGPWEKSVSFNLDQIGVFTVELKKKVDLASIPHVNTRGAAEYSIELPPNRLLGLGFETDWGEENIVVKSIQSGSYAARETDVRVGDVLLEVDGSKVSGSKFEEAMTFIKSKLQRSVCVLKLRTVEEKLRLLREAAFQQIQKKEQDRKRNPRQSSSSTFDGTEIETKDSMAVRVELRQVESSIVVLVNELNAEKMEEYRIENQSVSFRLYYRQKGIAGAAWNYINPGQSTSYIFEDPSKPHKLLIHVGENVLCPSDYRNTVRFEDNGEMGDKGKGDESLGTYLGYLAGMKADSAIVLNLDEIGFSEDLPLPKSESKLLATVRSEGPTKVLVITPSRGKYELLTELDYSTDFIFDHLIWLKEFAAQVESIRKALFDALSGKKVDSNVPTAIAIIYHEHVASLQTSQQNIYAKYSKSKDPEFKSEGSLIKSHTTFTRLYDAGIEKHHQLLVDVLEARDITPFVAGKAEDIYCRIYVRNREKRGIIDRNFRNSQYTYVCDQTFEPKWLHQRFLFDIDRKAIDDIRNYSIRILVKAKSIATVDSVISKVDIPLTCLKNEEEIEGWFSLRQSVNSSIAGLRTSGSIKLRLQWIYTEYGFSGYVLEQCNRRARELLLYHNVLQFIASRLKKQLMHGVETPNLNSTSQVDLLSREERSYYYRILDMAKEREAAKLKIPSINNDQSSFADKSATVQMKSLKKGLTVVRETEEQKAPLDVFERKFVKFSLDNNDSSNDAEDQVLDSEEIRAYHVHGRIMRQWLRTLADFFPLHQKLSSHMHRTDVYKENMKNFQKIFNLEAKRNFDHVYTSSCILEIQPLKVENIPIKNSYVHGKISYGEYTFRTRSIPSSHYMTWSDDFDEFSKDANRGDSHQHVDEPHDKKEAEDLETGISGKFEIDLLNVKGSIKIRLIAETFPSTQEFARIEIPVFGLIDSTCALKENEWFHHDFPLLLSNSPMSRAANGHNSVTNRLLEKNQPRITLAIRMCDRKDIHSLQGRRNYYRLQVPSFSFSCIDSYHAREVMLITLISLELKSASARESSNFTLILSSLQVDNQLLDAMSSVILYPTPVKSPQPVIRLHVKKKNLLSQSNLECYETIQFIIQELDLKLEQQVVLATWEMIKSWTKEVSQDRKERTLNSKTDQISIDQSGVESVKEEVIGDNRMSARQFFLWKRHQEESTALEFDIAPYSEGNRKLIDDENVEKLYIDDFRIFPIKINVSFLINPRFIIRKYRKEQREDMANDNASVGLYSALSVLLWQIGTVVLDLTSSISDAPIFFNGFEVPHLFKTNHDVTKTLQEHYFHSALGQLYKIVFSSEVVGNPIGLLNSLSIGVHDFFYEPAHALITTPTEISKIGKGFVKGAASLLSNATVGFIGTSTTITRSVGRGVLKLSTDESFIKAREKLQQNPKNVKDTLTRPLKDIGNGFYHGLTGLITVPYRAMKKKGTRGIVPGLAKGIIGLGADPVVGILDAVTHCGDAAREIVKTVNKRPERVIDRVRLGTVFGVDGRILQYDFNTAFGTQILNAMARPISDEENNLIAAAFLQGNNFVHEVLGGSDEIISLQQANRMSFVQAPSRNSISHQSRSNSYAVTRLSLHNPQSLETYSNPLTAGGGSNIEQEEDGNSSDDSQFQPHHRGSLSRNPAPIQLTEEDDTEYVIHTAIIHKRIDGMEYDVVAIVSSKRLIILEHHRRGHGTYLKKKWEATLKQLAPPTVVTSEGDAALTLQLSLLDDRLSNMGRRRSFLNVLHSGNNQSPDRVQGKGKYNQYQVKGNYLGDHVIINLYNSVNTLLGNFDDLEKMDIGKLSVCFEDEQGIRHIGPWQYSRSLSKSRTFRRNGQLKLIYRDEEDAQLLLEENRRVINKLKYENWHFTEDDEPARVTIQADDRPNWLILEEKQATVDQNKLRSLHEACKKLESEVVHLSPANQDIVRHLLADFHARKLDQSEFFQKVEEAQRADREDDQSHASTNAAEKKPKKALLQSAMRRLSFLGSLSRRSSQKKIPEINSESFDGTISLENQHNQPEKVQGSEGSVGKEMLRTDSNEEDILETVVPFSKRRVRQSHQNGDSPHRESLGRQSNLGFSVSPTSSILSVKATEEMKGDDEVSVNAAGKKRTWLWKLFNDNNDLHDDAGFSDSFRASQEETTYDSPSEFKHSSSFIEENNLDFQDANKTDSKGQDGFKVDTFGEFEEGDFGVDYKKNYRHNTVIEEGTGELFDIFPVYDRFEVDFNDNGDLLETKFSESRTPDMKMDLPETPKDEKDVSRTSLDESRLSLRSPPQMGHQESPRSTGYSSLRPRTEGTYRSIDDSRFSNLQLDQMNERLSRIETLLLNLMPNQSSTNQIVNDFIRPDVHEISQDIRNIHFEDELLVKSDDFATNFQLYENSPRQSPEGGGFPSCGDQADDQLSTKENPTEQNEEIVDTNVIADLVSHSPILTALDCTEQDETDTKTDEVEGEATPIIETELVDETSQESQKQILN